MSTIPEPLRRQIEEAASKSPDLNNLDNGDPVDDNPTVEDGPDDQ